MGRITVQLLFIVLMQFNYNLAAKQKSRVLLFEEVSTTCNPEYLNKFELLLSEEKHGFDVEILLIKNITEPVWNKLSVEMKLKKENQYKKIFGYETNVCDFIGVSGRSAVENNIIMTWVQNALKYSNLPKSCPVLEGSYSWRNFKVEKNSIPPFAVNGLYRVNVTNFLKMPETQITEISFCSLIVNIKMK
ncbi:uncharacterized protein [Musca autumnalis]|uniref:uncharacterized protein n=1 Tax=Musca autumnalis TaxID=221902 RepID=UPI003CF39248